MRLERSPKRRPIGITSLIDVIFLLLLFFMLASSFSRYQALPVTAGTSGSGSGERPLLLRVHGERRWDLNGEPVTGEELAARLSDQTLRTSKSVAILSGPDAMTQHVVDAMTIVRKSGLNTVLVTGH